MSILSVDQIQPIGSGTTVTLNATEVKTGTEITVGTGASIFSPAGNTLTFGTNNEERIRIKNDGSILIGTSTEGISNADDLTIATSGHTGLTIRSGTSNQGNIFFSDGTSGADEYRGYLQYEHTANTLIFGTDAVERLRITSTGQLLVGTNSGGGTLRVFGSSGRIIIGDSSVNYYDGDTHIFRNYAATEALRIDSSGRVMIGTTTEGHNNAENLTVSASGAAGITIRSTGNNCHLYFSDATSGAGEYVGQIAYNHSSDYMSFATGDGSERLRIDSDGKLSTGGESSPDVNPGGLCLNTGSSDGIFFSCKNSDIAHGRTALDETDTLLSMRKISGNNGGVEVRSYTDAAGADPAVRIFGIIDDGTDATYCPVELRGARKNTGGNAGTSAMGGDRGVVRISNDGDFTVATFTGEGLCFHSDTAVANAIDDYEEGTWTPTINAGITISNNDSTYVKIGRSVTAKFYVSIPGTFGATAGTSTDLQFDGLPYTSASDGYHTGVIDIGNGGKVGAFLRTQSSNTNMVVLVSSGSKGTARDHLNGDTIGGGDYIIGSITYQTD